jgi:hypothetical protein
MNWKHKLCLTLTLAVIPLVTLPLATAWADECPPGSKVYVGGPVTDSTAIRGSKANPATDMDEAFDICQECPNGAYIYEYNADKEEYAYAGLYVPEEAEPTGVPLAQSVTTALLGLLAVGLLAWGIHLRLRLKRLQTGG